MVVSTNHHVNLRAVARALGALLLIGAATSAAYADIQVGQTLPPPPSVLYGDLFVAVQTAQIYPDQKTFVDATPNADPAAIVQLYEQQKNNPGFSLKNFVAQYFTPPIDQVITPPPNQSLREHIDWLWPELTRTTHERAAQQLADPDAEALRRAGRTFSRGLLLGHLFHDAGSCRKRAAKISSTTCSTTSRT